MKIYSKTAIILISASIIPLTIISLISYILAEKTITREELLHLQAIAHIQKHRIEEMIGRNRERLDLITSRVPMRVAMLEFMKSGDRRQLEIVISALSGAKEAVKDIKKVYILSLDGRVVASTDRAMHGTDHSGMEYFIRGKGGYSLDVFSSDAKGEVMNYLSAPIYHDGMPIGVLVVESGFEPITSITRDYIGLKNTGESFLARRDKDGDALYIVPLRFDPKAALKRKISRHDSHVPITQALLKNERASADQVDYRGKPVLAFTSYIKETDWGFVVKMDKDEAYIPLAKLRYLTAAFVVITLILISALVFYTAHSFTAPIVSLTHAARRIGEGDLSVRAAVTSTDEIGDLERYFNMMTEELIAVNASLKTAQRIAHIGSWELNLVNNLLTWSDEIYRIFEIDPKKFGASYEAFLNTIHPEDRTAVELAYNNYLKTRSPYAIDHRLLFPDGRIKHVHEQCETFYDSDGKALLSAGTVQEITKQKKDEVDIQRHSDIEVAIGTVLRMSLEDTTIDKLIKDTLDLILSIPWLALDSRGSIFLVDGDPNVLVMKVQNGLHESIQKECARLPFGKCLCGLAALKREVQFAGSLDERHEVVYNGISPHGHYCVPILSGDKVLGVINTYLKAGHRQNQMEIEFLTAIANEVC